jgi:hypothetical protein
MISFVVGKITASAVNENTEHIISISGYLMNAKKVYIQLLSEKATFVVISMEFLRKKSFSC